MIALFSDTAAEAVKKKRKKYILISLVTVLIVLIASITLCFFVDDDNAVLFEIIDIVLCSAGFCTALFFIFNVIVPLGDRQKHLYRMLDGDKRIVSGEVSECGGAITLSKNVSAYEITLRTDDNAENLLYWDTEYALPDIVGKRIDFQVVQNIVYGYEEKE